VAVPEQLAVIAGDDEDVACRMAIPPLSAVVNSAHQIGYEAASLLDTLMQGKPAAEPRLFILPERVVTRQSTDIMAIRDPLVATTLQFIREHACRGINVDDVLRAVLVSRTKLQDRVRQALGRTIHDIIVSFRVERAKELLAETSLPLPDIARRTGFKHVQYLSDVFQQRVGSRPGKYRAQHGSRLSARRESER
jgi:LacI family transcriptional regulator